MSSAIDNSQHVLVNELNIKYSVQAMENGS